MGKFQDRRNRMKEKKIKKVIRALALIPLLCMAIAIPIAAQGTSGTMSGNVLDEQGGAIANATVTIVEQNKDQKFTSQTDGQGRFVFALVPPGLYTLTVEGTGFKKLERKDVTLNASDKLSVGDLTMEVGTVKEIIEVQATGAELKTESAERSDAL